MPPLVSARARNLPLNCTPKTMKSARPITSRLTGGGERWEQGFSVRVSVCQNSTDDGWAVCVTSFRTRMSGPSPI